MSEEAKRDVSRGHSTPLLGQLGREAQGLKESPAVKSPADVARRGHLQLSEVLELIRRKCPFQLLHLDTAAIQTPRRAACGTDLFTRLGDFTCHSEI